MYSYFLQIFDQSFMYAKHWASVGLNLPVESSPSLSYRPNTVFVINFHLPSSSSFFIYGPYPYFSRYSVRVANVQIPPFFKAISISSNTELSRWLSARIPEAVVKSNLFVNSYGKVSGDPRKSLTNYE